MGLEWESLFDKVINWFDNTLLKTNYLLYIAVGIVGYVIYKWFF